MEAAAGPSGHEEGNDEAAAYGPCQVVHDLSKTGSGTFDGLAGFGKNPEYADGREEQDFSDQQQADECGAVPDQEYQSDQVDIACHDRNPLSEFYHSYTRTQIFCVFRT